MIGISVVVSAPTAPKVCLWLVDVSIGYGNGGHGLGTDVRAVALSPIDG
jgi:hypothetical protein